MNKSFIISNINRIEYIDIAKGLGMILVVLGHCINSKTFRNHSIFRLDISC